MRADNNGVTARLCLPAHIYHPAMWGRRSVCPEAEALALKASVLEDNAACAGAVLGCAYANSREYEAELIAVRRAAGAYRPKRSLRRVWIAIAAGIAAVIAVILLAG